MVRVKNIFIIFLLIFFSCPTSYSPPDDAGLPGEKGLMGLVEELFEEEYDELGRRVTVFLLNDNAYWSEYGYTLWTAESGDGEDIFTTREVLLNKIKGDRVAGYGIVICQRIRSGYGQTMLTIMLNTEQSYAIGKVIGGNYMGLKPWTHSAYILQGYGRPNVLKVTYDKDKKEYTLVINGYEIEKFKDENEPVHEGGRNGYIVVISPHDKFPNNPVEVTFVE